MFWDGISSISDEKVKLLCLGRHCLVCGHTVGLYHEKEPGDTIEVWVCVTGMGQQVV